MKRFTIILPLLIAAIALVVTFGLAAELQQVKAQIEGVTNYNGVHLSQSTFGTATPQLLIQNSGSANSLEVRDGSATPIVYIDADGNSTFAGTVDLSGATVSGVSTSTLTSLTVSGATALNGGITADTNAFSVADTTGNTVISGTLTVSGTADFNGAVDMSNQTLSNIGAAGTDFSGTGGLTLADDLNMSNQPIVNIGAAGTDFGTNGSLTLAAGLTVTAGDTDLGGGLNYGSDNLYPLGIATADQQIACGTTGTFTGSTTVDVTALSTATYVLATQVTAPITTAAYLHVSDPTTTTITLTSLNSTFGAGTTGVTAHYCAIGDE